jgi:hypothetical protein
MTLSGASMIVFYISFTIVAFHLLPCNSFSGFTVNITTQCFEPRSQVCLGYRTAIQNPATWSVDGYGLDIV